MLLISIFIWGKMWEKSHVTNGRKNKKVWRHKWVSISFCSFSPYYLFSYHIVIVRFEYFVLEIYIFLVWSC